MDKQNKKFAKDIKEVSVESAERANQLSRYVDQEIKRVTEVINKKYDKLKIIFAKFGEQFKNHLINTETFKQETVEKIKDLEDTLYRLRDEIGVNMQRLEGDFEQKMKEEREFLEGFVKSAAKVLEDKVNKLKEQLDNDVEIMKEAMENSRSIFMNKIQKLMDLQDSYHRTYIENIMKILGEIELMKTNVNGLKVEVDHHSLKLAEDFKNLRAYVEVEFINERALRANSIEDVYTKLKENINALFTDVNLLRNQLEGSDRQRLHDQKINEEKFENFGNSISDLYNKLNRAQDELIVKTIPFEVLKLNINIILDIGRKDEGRV